MAKKRAPRSIPVVIVAGFLGSGKTTLLNHLLHNNGGTRIGV
ncbi:GTP-binding protein, partial [Rhodococcus hoagii]|nr:GTP-binding protein [Prescottella equi]